MEKNNELQFALIGVALKSLGKMLVEAAEQLMIYNNERKEPVSLPENYGDDRN